MLSRNEFIVVHELFGYYLLLLAISSEELVKHEDYFVNLAISLLSAYKVLIYFLTKVYLRMHLFF